MTLVEVMIAVSLFALLATGTAATLITTRKHAESYIYAVQAQTIAQTIMEQVQIMPYSILSDTTSPPALTLQFIGTSVTNNAQVQNFDLDWIFPITDETTFVPIGEVQGGITKGVLLDVDYRNGATILRQKRYMKMSINLRKQVDTISGNVGIILTYRWQIPDRTKNGPVFLTRQIRSARSQAPSY